MEKNKKAINDAALNKIDELIKNVKQKTQYSSGSYLLALATLFSLLEISNLPDTELKNMITKINTMVQNLSNKGDQKVIRKYLENVITKLKKSISTEYKQTVEE